MEEGNLIFIGVILSMIVVVVYTSVSNNNIINEAEKYCNENNMYLNKPSVERYGFECFEEMKTPTGTIYYESRYILRENTKGENK